MSEPGKGGQRGTRSNVNTAKGPGAKKIGGDSFGEEESYSVHPDWELTRTSTDNGPVWKDSR